MHKSKYRNIISHHNGDYSGNVNVVVPNDLNDKESATMGVIIPFDVIKGFVADYVRTEKISKLEIMTSDELLKMT